MEKSKMAPRVRLKATSFDEALAETFTPPSTPRAALHGSAREEAREPQHTAEHAPSRRTRRHKSTINDDIFHIPLEEIPEGSSYEWKRWSNLGLEDPFYIAQMREQGWEPVNPKKHPNWVPPGYVQPHIIKGGQILMERPIELTLEAQAEQRKLSKQQMREAEQRLGMTPRDTGTRDLPEVKPRVVKEIGRMVSTGGNMSIEE
jgi:hypothetical protein